MKRILSLLATIGLTAMLAMPGPVAAKQFSAWGTPQLVDGVNTASLEGCAMQSPDGLSLYFASDRPGGLGSPTFGSHIGPARTPPGARQ
jgi:hypothetical protein